MPLELFDAADLEPLDTAAWQDLGARVAAGAPPLLARSRFRGTQGQLSWLPCEVLQYDAEANRFELAWVSSGKRKWASRLNLIFDAEDEGRFHARVAQARRLRAQVEEATRCDFYARHEVADALSEWHELITPQKENKAVRQRVPRCAGLRLLEPGCRSR